MNFLKFWVRVGITNETIDSGMIQILLQEHLKIVLELDSWMQELQLVNIFIIDQST